MFAVDADFFGGFDFAADIDFRGRVVSDENDCEAGADTSGRHRLHFGGDFGTNFSGDFIAVEKGCGGMGHKNCI